MIIQHVICCYAYPCADVLLINFESSTSRKKKFRIFQNILNFPSQKNFFEESIFEKSFSISKNNITCTQVAKVLQYMYSLIDFMYHQSNSTYLPTHLCFNFLLSPPEKPHLIPTIKLHI